ncbi:Hypothetical protein F387_01757 [Wohlfahrtiimonas chitiniclastica SH04]|uniref:Uncharacterized protein n=1 Tax=Wohlfahrtiimonas chitiniclastica SH04 TaxID=1261130 RepID=L8XWN7_9GAMM|nr:type I-F CRISPR-associated endoribonuclease Cas6/Csy4 [Wohlfahrtiimonas chitiniclastica]ELV08438.1 Hypothetical protein F387_01757 [Wohlfahrtiimonas chitiniclastica SH04]
MKYFIELTLLDNRDIALRKLWSKIYDQLHLRLVEAKNLRGQTNIGVSFPEYQSNEVNNIHMIGSKLRIFSPSKLSLEQIDLHKYLKHWLDYIHITSIREVPKEINGYAIYKRKRINGESAINKKIMQYAAYRAEKENITYEEAVQIYQHWSISQTILPYIVINSTTSKQCLRLYIEKIETSSLSTDLFFSTYGLSFESSIPEF